jgi:aspartyl-tRNA(Asn)/glutamyl-tRNA(Gln) amidotransferase subunit A
MAREDELCFMPASRLAGMIARRELSPVELMEAVLARADRLEPKLNMFAMMLADSARAAAKSAEAAVIRGDRLGPLHGVPITIKDNVPTAGLATRNGTVALGEFVPTADAVVVKRVKAAGAIPIGKTNLPEFAHKVLTDSPLFGVTRSPWSLEHTPGGSSGGASAALAAGVAPLAIGTDGGGSIRFPASCTGVFGLKATLGRIPFEAFPDAFGNYAFVGPMTRTAEDLPLLFSVMSGSSPDDPYSLAVPPFAHRPQADAVRGLRVAWVQNFGTIRAEPEVAGLVSKAVSTLQSLGAWIETPEVPALADVFETYVVIATSAHGARLGAIAEKWGDQLSASIRKSIARGLGYSAADLLRATDRRTELFRAVQKLFDTYDVIVTPTMTAPPKTVDAGGSIESDMYAEWAGYLYPFNLTGHPAMSVPCGFTKSGLPVGLQIVGPWHGEQRMIDASIALAAADRWSERRPTI